MLPGGDGDVILSGGGVGGIATLGLEGHVDSDGLGGHGELIIGDGDIVAGDLIHHVALIGGNGQGDLRALGGLSGGSGGSPVLPGGDGDVVLNRRGVGGVGLSAALLLAVKGGHGIVQIGHGLVHLILGGAIPVKDPLGGGDGGVQGAHLPVGDPLLVGGHVRAVGRGHHAGLGGSGGGDGGVQSGLIHLDGIGLLGLGAGGGDPLGGGSV